MFSVNNLPLSLTLSRKGRGKENAVPLLQGEREGKCSPSPARGEGRKMQSLSRKSEGRKMQSLSCKWRGKETRNPLPIPPPLAGEG